LSQPAAFAVPAVAKLSIAAIKAIRIGLVFIQRYTQVGFLECWDFQRHFNSRAILDARAIHAHAIHFHATRDARAIRGPASRRHRRTRQRLAADRIRREPGEHRPPEAADATQAAIELLRFVLGDAETDISVVARELRLSDASFLRLRRALDRLNCAQSILEAMRAEESCGETGVPMQMRRRMRDAVDLLAKGWPEDYPAGAVEWLLLDGRRH
jgi:hypothetical protein